MAKDTKKPDMKPGGPPAPLEAAVTKLETLAFSSPLAAELVRAVPEPERVPLLGDLLAAVLPYAGERHQAETAEETVRRLTAEVESLRKEKVELAQAAREATEARTASAAELATLKTAMTARRSPDSAMVSRFAFIRQALYEAGEKLEGERAEETAVVHALNERKALREVLGDARKPGQVAFIRDDSADGVQERYTLLLGEVKHGVLSLGETIGGTRAPWVDLRPIVEGRVVPFLTPAEHGGRR